MGGRQAVQRTSIYIFVSTGSDCCPAASEALKLTDRRADLELNESSRPFTGERSACCTVPVLLVFCYLLGTAAAQGRPRHTLLGPGKQHELDCCSRLCFESVSLTLTGIMLGYSWSLISSGSEAHTSCAKLYMLLLLAPFCLA